MPEERTLKRAKSARRAGKAPSTQAGEFVREEMDHIREGKHGARSSKQAIAIGLSKARRAGVKIPKKKASKRSSVRGGNDPGRPSLAKRSRSKASLRALRREPSAAASHRALSRQARAAARERSPAERSAAAKKAAKTRARTRAQPR